MANYNIEPVEWQGHPDPLAPDDFWIDDETGERVCAENGERSPADAIFYQEVRAGGGKVRHEVTDGHGNTIAELDTEAAARAFVEAAKLPA